MKFIFASIGGASTYFGAKAAICYAGFKSTGIAAGSYAAGMMSAAAKAKGGAVAAGSIVSVLQSIGAAGFSVASSIALVAVGGVATLAVKLFKRN